MSRNTDDAALWLQNELPDGTTSIRVRARNQGGAMRVLGQLPVPAGGLGSVELVDAFQLQVQELLDRAAPDAVDVRLEAFVGRRLNNSYLYAVGAISDDDDDDGSTPAGANALLTKGVAALLKETVAFVRAQTSTVQALGGVTVGLAEHLGEVHVAHQRDRLEMAELLAMAQGDGDDGSAATAEMQSQALAVLQQGLAAMSARKTSAPSSSSSSSSSSSPSSSVAETLAKMSDDEAASLLKDPGLKSRFMGLIASGKVQL